MDGAQLAGAETHAGHVLIALQIVWLYACGLVLWPC